MPSTGSVTQERVAFALPGLVGLVLVILLFAGAAGLLFLGVGLGKVGFVLPGLAMGIFGFLCVGGMFVIQPNQAEVLVFLGKYRGTVKEAGWYWTNPFTSKRKISLRVQNFNTPRLKVNDADGNPIEIAAVVVWRVLDTGRATFDVENYSQFIEIQSETALRHITTQYPYDVGTNDKQPTLRGSADVVGKALKDELQDRLSAAGIEVIETRLTHLAYSPEIAGAMLQRQQAAAIIAARSRIATGAVGIVETVLENLARSGAVKLTADQKAQMVSSLLIVLTSERGAQPVLSAQAQP
ncbi:MAG TPA: SPFH domain-containing protein [Candidatus Thermoplasmatota archaeon]|nr:SPFH domain-containing protein [Candidatus Thermoplasmatota archaeon]